MTDIRFSTAPADDAAAIGPLERAEGTADTIVLHLGLYAEMASLRATDQLTVELEEKFIGMVAATIEAAQA
jgi:hypothetical protein